MNEIEERAESQGQAFNVEVKPNGTEVFTEPYSERAVRRLKKLVLNFYYQGSKKYYSIHVDGEKVVDRTSDGRKFNRYLQFVEKETRVIEVRLYMGESFNCNRYLFIINKDEVSVEKEDMEERIKQALEAQEKENELLYLRAALEKKERKLKKLKKQVGEKDEGISLGAVKEFLIEGKGLVDAFRGNGSSTQLGDAPPVQETEVTIEAEEEPSEEEKIFTELYQHVGKKGIKKALNIMAILSQNPDLEDIVVQALKKKEEEENGEA